MLTVMCPNCRHRFPAPGCCNSNDSPTVSTTTTTVNLDRHPTSASGGLLLVDTSNLTNNHHGQQVTISTQCGIQSGGCLIQSSNAEILVHGGNSPLLEVRSNLSGGGCLVQKNTAEPEEPSTNQDQCRPLLITEEQLRNSFEQAKQFHRSHSTTARLEPPPSGCQELPGSRLESGSNEQRSTNTRDCRCCCYCRCCRTYCRSGGKCCCDGGADRHLARCRSKECKLENANVSLDNGDLERDTHSGDVRIQVNATVRLPSTRSSGSCTLNITASTSSQAATTEPSSTRTSRSRNNFNGGGIVSVDSNPTSREETPGTPVSWLMPCPWSFDSGYLPDKDVARLTEVRRLLQSCGWYHEGLSWQQSENLLKDAPVGRWLMRDSSDRRYTFAISVQTARGPTSVRVFYFMGKFRLDAEPRLALAMPLFDCPIRMLEYYCEYSKRMDEHRREVWVDYSGQVYSQIYLSEPLLKEVRSLSHLARIAVNRDAARLEKTKESLPPLIRNYLDEYPYTL